MVAFHLSTGQPNPTLQASPPLQSHLAASPQRPSTAVSVLWPGPTSSHFANRSSGSSRTGLDVSNAAPHRRSWYRARNCHGKHFTPGIVVSGRGSTLAFCLRRTSSIDKTSDAKCAKRSKFRLRNSIRPRQIAYSAATARFKCWICGQHIASDLGIRLSCLRCLPPRHKPSRHPRICRHRRSTASGHPHCRCPEGPPAAEQPSTKTILLSLPARPAHRATVDHARAQH